MSIDSAFEFLLANSWLGECDSQLASALKDIASVRTFKDDQVVFLEGDEVDAVYAIVSGAFRVLIPQPDGTQYLAHREGPGWWIGEMGAIAGLPHIFSAWTEGPTEVVVVPTPQLLALLEREPQYHRDFFASTRNTFQRALDAMSNLALDSTEKRIGRRLLFQHIDNGDADGWLTLTQGDLAEMLAMSAATLQRSLHRMEENGLVELGYRRIRIADFAKMEEMVSGQL